MVLKVLKVVLSSFGDLSLVSEFYIVSWNLLLPFFLSSISFSFFDILLVDSLTNEPAPVATKVIKPPERQSLHTFDGIGFGISSLRCFGNFTRKYLPSISFPSFYRCQAVSFLNI